MWRTRTNRLEFNFKLSYPLNQPRTLLLDLLADSHGLLRNRAARFVPTHHRTLRHLHLLAKLAYLPGMHEERNKKVAPNTQSQSQYETEKKRKGKRNSSSILKAFGKTQVLP